MAKETITNDIDSDLSDVEKDRKKTLTKGRNPSDFSLASAFLKKDKEDKGIKEEKKDDASDDKEEKEPSIQLNEEKKEKKVEEKKEEPKKEEKVLTDDEEVAELLKLEIDKITTGSGKPLSRKSTETMERFKNSLKKKQEFIDKFRVEFDELKKKSDIKFEDTEDYKKISSERDDLKKIVDTEYYLNSADFKKTFVQPIREAEADAVKWLKHVSADDKSVVDSMIQSMNSALASRDEVDFLNKASEVKKYLSDAAGIKFVNAAERLYDSTTKYDQAKEDKESSKKIIEKKRSESSSEVETKVEKLISSFESDFESTNKGLVDLFTTNEQISKIIDYKDSKKSSLDKAKKCLSDFATTGVPSQELISYLFDGAMFKGVRSKELKMQSETISAYLKANETLTKENEKLKSDIKKLSSSGGRSTHQANDDEEDDKPKSDKDPTGFALVNAWRKKMAS